MSGDESQLLANSAVKPAPRPQPGLASSAGSAELPEQLLIGYRPYGSIERWLKYRFSAWSEFKAWFVMTLVVLFFFFGGPGLILQAIIYLLVGEAGSAAAAAAAAAANQLILYAFMYGLFAAGTVLAVVYLKQPTNLGLSRSGLQLRWMHGFLRRAGPLISWEQLSHVYLWRPSGQTSPQDYWLCFATGANRRVLKLKLGAITTAVERGQLLLAIETWAPQLSRDPVIMELLAPPQDHSYTELWLKALSAPPKRERLTPLPEGASLQDGRYLVRGQLGVGGQGTAYLAVDLMPDKTSVAASLSVDKAANPRSREELASLAPVAGGSTEAGGSGNSEAVVVLKESILPVYVDINVRRQALERFQNEAAMLRNLDHPQIVRMMDFFVEDHRSYLVLEHIDGVSLRQLVQLEGAQTNERVKELAIQMCEILSYLHSLVPPVVHRDFTPDNLILCSDGRLKLVDFNVAQQTESTTTGTVVGKHAYIPPEQFRGKPTCQSDIYALGATLDYLLIGSDPEPISTSHPIIICDSVSPQLDAIVARATEIDSRSRYTSVACLKEDLLELDQIEAVL